LDIYSTILTKPDSIRFNFVDGSDSFGFSLSSTQKIV